MLTSMSQAARPRLLFVLASVFDLHVRLASAGRRARLPCARAAPAPTAPGWSSFRVAGAAGAGQLGAGRAQSRCQRVRNASFQGQSGLFFRIRFRAWRTRRAGCCPEHGPGTYRSSRGALRSGSYRCGYRVISRNQGALRCNRPDGATRAVPGFRRPSARSAAVRLAASDPAACRSPTHDRTDQRSGPDASHARRPSPKPHWHRP
jgi:hypothetical protein